MRSIVKPAVLLFLVCIAVSFAVAYTYAVTRDTILRREEEEKMLAMQAVIPGAVSFEDITPEAREKALSLGMETVIQHAYRTEKGMVFHLSVLGYADRIILTVGIRRDRTVSGVRIGRNAETPSLGKRIEEQTFTDRFLGLPVHADVLQEIDDISGATISSRAVMEGVQDALHIFRLIAREEDDT